MSEPQRVTTETSRSLREKTMDLLTKFTNKIQIGGAPTTSISLEDDTSPQEQATPTDHNDQLFPPQEENLRQAYVDTLTGVLFASGLNEKQYVFLVDTIDKLLAGQPLSTQDQMQIAADEVIDTALAKLKRVLNGPEPENPDLFLGDFSQADGFQDELFLHKIKTVWDEAVTKTKKTFNQE